MVVPGWSMVSTDNQKMREISTSTSKMKGRGYWSCQSFVDGSVGEPFDPRPGISLKGVLDFKPAARMAQLDTRTVG